MGRRLADTTWGFLSVVVLCSARFARTMLQAAVAAFFPFMGADAQASLAERGAAAVSGLPVEPPLHRASSDAAMDSALDFVHCADTVAAGGATGSHVATSAADSSAVTTPSSSALGLAAAVATGHIGSCAELGPPVSNVRTLDVDMTNTAAVWADHTCLNAGSGGHRHLDMRAGVEGMGWEEGEADGLGRNGVPLSARSSSSLRSLASLRGARMPVRLSVKIAGVRSHSLQKLLHLRVYLYKWTPSHLCSSPSGHLIVTFEIVVHLQGSIGGITHPRTLLNSQQGTTTRLAETATHNLLDSARISALTSS
jgi:hypothetical protein